MSNRPRRRLLREWRMLALVLNDAAPPDPDSIQSLEEWNRLHRDAFRFLWREPLRFPNNIRPDAGLINIQARNMPEPFNPLTDSVPERPEHLREFGNSNDPPFLWEKTEEAIYSALGFLEPARTITRARFAPWFDEVETIEDYPARFYRAFRKLRTGMGAVHQYGDDGNPWFRDHGSAARNILNLDQWTAKSWPYRPIERITEPELYALLALAACWWALRELRRLPETWSRDDLDYIAGKVRDAERWLAEAYRLNESHEKQAAIRAEAATEKAAILGAWADDSHRAKSANGGKAEKGSRGVRLLALALRDETPSASAERLFRAALARAAKDNESLMAAGYTIAATTDDQLVSTDPNGKPDGLPVSLSGWRKILTPSKGFHLLALSLRNALPDASAESLFDEALARCDMPQTAGGYTITTNAKGQLVSIGSDGKPDGLPVSLPVWKKILRRKR